MSCTVPYLYALNGIGLLQRGRGLLPAPAGQRSCAETALLSGLSVGITRGR